MSQPEDIIAEESSSSSDILIRVFGRTDVGLVREHNEDNFLVADLNAGNRSIKPEVREHFVGKKGSLFVVCDGMGGAAAGEVASKIGIDTIYEMMQNGSAADDDEALALKLEAAITEAGMRILTAAKVDRRRRGMGTTVTAAVLNGPKLILGQVGDSRAYILRGEEMIQVTKDQSLVQQLLDAKQLTEEEARNFDRANIILQALGTAEELHVDLTTVDLRQGDTLMMCSDGLTGPATDEIIKEVLITTDDPATACKQLTDLACDGGGQDNITVITAKFEGGGLVEPEKDNLPTYQKFAFPVNLKETVPATSGIPIVMDFDDDPDLEVPERKAEPVRQPGRKPKTAAPRKTSFVIAGAIVLVLCCAVAAYMLLLKEEAPETGDTEQIIVEDLPVPDILENGPDTGKSPDSEVHSEAPSLAPTPEEAILGTEEEWKPRPKPPGSENESGADQTNQGGSEAPAAEKPKPPKPAEDKPQPVSPPEEPAPSPGVAPAPIDENPF